MKFPLFAIAAILTIGLSYPLLTRADSLELGAPIVELMPHLQKLAAGLNLGAEKQATLDAWQADAPRKREQLEAETLALRAQLREAILTDADRMTRERLKA